MADVERITAEEARRQVASNGALLVCAYEDQETWNRMKLAGSMPLGSFQSRLSSVPQDQEIIFYCA